ncbi:hypothetical protein [Streptomyces sp. NPDC001508]|uniref:hypothetical protein n=1 Tax=Streptomyces sp. NPDC001508 TaxID=3154656 RepID=UPI003322B2DA
MLAERGMVLVLLHNDGTLFLGLGRTRVLVTGPGCDEIRIRFGLYTSVAADEMPAAISAVRIAQVPGVDPARFAATDIVTTSWPDSSRSSRSWPAPCTPSRPRCSPWHGNST